MNAPQSEEYRNIFRFTTADVDTGKVGERLPALWLRNDGKLHLGTQIGTNGDRVFRSPVLPKDTWFDIEYEQSFVNNEVT